MTRELRKASLYSLIAYMMIALGIVAWKNVIATYSISQVLIIEALVCIPLFIGMAKAKGGLHLLKTSYPRLQILRGISQTCACYIGLYGLIHLPVSTYTMLGYCTPFIITLSAWIFLKEKCPPAGWACIVIGFIGTALIIQPEYTRNFVAALAVVASCGFWAANVILMRQMPKDHVVSFPFYTVIIVNIVSCMVVMINGIIPMTLIDFSLVAIAGVLFFIGAQILFITYRLAPLYILTPFQYTQIIWVALLSYFLWADTPTLVQIIGLIIIIIATIYSSFLKEKKEILSEQ